MLSFYLGKGKTETKEFVREWNACFFYLSQDRKFTVYGTGVGAKNR